MIEKFVVTPEKEIPKEEYLTSKDELALEFHKLGESPDGVLLCSNEIEFWSAVPADALSSSVSIAVGKRLGWVAVASSDMHADDGIYAAIGHTDAKKSFLFYGYASNDEGDPEKLASDIRTKMEILSRNFDTAGTVVMAMDGEKRTRKAVNIIREALRASKSTGKVVTRPKSFSSLLIAATRPVVKAEQALAVLFLLVAASLGSSWYIKKHYDDLYRIWRMELEKKVRAVRFETTKAREANAKTQEKIDQLEKLLGTIIKKDIYGGEK